jgi:hypothetical protein
VTDITMINALAKTLQEDRLREAGIRKATK